MGQVFGTQRLAKIPKFSINKESLALYKRTIITRRSSLESLDHISCPMCSQNNYVCTFCKLSSTILNGKNKSLLKLQSVQLLPNFYQTNNG